MCHRRTLSLGILLSLMVAVGAEARVTRFDFKDAGMRNLVELSSDMPLERIVGITNFLSGWIELDPERLGGGVRGEFEVDLRTFQTGIEARDELLREKILNVGEYPKAVFAPERFLKLSKQVLSDSQVINGRWEGTLKVRGVAKPQSMFVKLMYFKESDKTKQRLMGNLLKVNASFDIDSAQFNLSIPEMLRHRLSKFVQLTIDAVGTDRLPAVLPARTEASTPPSPSRPVRK